MSGQDIQDQGWNFFENKMKQIWLFLKNCLFHQFFFSNLSFTDWPLSHYSFIPDQKQQYRWKIFQIWRNKNIRIFKNISEIRPKIFQNNLVDFGDSSWKDQSFCSIVDYQVDKRDGSGQTKSCMHWKYKSLSMFNGKAAITTLCMLCGFGIISLEVFIT